MGIVTERGRLFMLGDNRIVIYAPLYSTHENDFQAYHYQSLLASAFQHWPYNYSNQEM